MSPRLNVAVKPSSSCRHLSTVLPRDSDSWRSAVGIPLLVTGPLHVLAAAPSVRAPYVRARFVAGSSQLLVTIF